MTSEERGEPWFEDGNLILQAEGNVCFRVHRGVLARQSEVFQDMLAIPQPSSSISNEGMKVETVPMYDRPIELSNLLKAIYDGVTFQNREIEDFYFLASILRLSTKYFIAHLRKQAIQALVQTWSTELEGHDAMVERALRADSGPFTFPYVHPIHVINLARETHVRVVLPSALYFLSVYPYPDLLDASHPKLAVESRFGLPRPSPTLSVEDMSNYTLMYQHRIEIILDFVRRFCGDRRSYSVCDWREKGLGETPPDRPTGITGNDPCSVTFARLASRASRSWYTRTGPLRWMLQVMQYLENNDMQLCRECKKAIRDDVESHRNHIWNNLPGVVGLPKWEDLIDEDLPESAEQPHK